MKSPTSNQTPEQPASTASRTDIGVGCSGGLGSVLDALESMCYQHCYTQRAERDYNGQVAGTLVTDSGALSANATALETLAEHGRFRVVAAGGRMVVGYWPENDPSLPNVKDDTRREMARDVRKHGA